MKKLLLFLLLLYSHDSFSITIEALQARLSQNAVIRADFIQEKQIKNISKPFISKGNVIVARNLGLNWHQKSPFQMEMKVNKERMVQIINGQSEKVINKESQPDFFEFNALLSAIFEADIVLLQENFSYQFQSDNDKWYLCLTPINKPFSLFFSQIELRGEYFLTQIIIEDKQGDKTIINLQNHNIEPLLKNEQKLF